MKRVIRFVLTIASVASAVVLSAQTAKEKSAGDVAAETFTKVREEKVDLGPARIQQVVGAGLDFLTAYPTHARAVSIVASMASFATSVRDPKLAPMRDYYITQVKYEIVNRRSPNLTEEGRTALVALDAAMTGAEARLKPSRDTVKNFREKIDQLAARPEASRFLFAQEKEYIQLLALGNLDSAEAHAKNLSSSSDKRIAAMARDELAQIVARKQAVELKFTALDGKVVDLASLRGKLVFLYFWSATNESLVKDLDKIKEVQADYKRDFEVVTVSLDSEEDRAKVTTAAKKIKWPVYFDGKGKQGELADKFGVRSAPIGLLFDRKGLLSVVGVRASGLEGEIKKATKTK
jgi:peroxiredoxin